MQNGSSGNPQLHFTYLTKHQAALQAKMNTPRPMRVRKSSRERKSAVIIIEQKLEVDAVCLESAPEESGARPKYLSRRIPNHHCRSRP